MEVEIEKEVIGSLEKLDDLPKLLRMYFKKAGQSLIFFEGLNKIDEEHWKCDITVETVTGNFNTEVVVWKSSEEN